MQHEKTDNLLHSADYGLISKILEIWLIWWMLQMEMNYFLGVTPRGRTMIEKHDFGVTCSAKNLKYRFLSRLWMNFRNNRDFINLMDGG